MYRKSTFYTILDAKCQLSNGKVVNIEVQKANDESYNVNKYPVTSNIKKRYKQTKEGQSVMCEIMERIEQDGRKEERERINKLNVILIKQGRTDDLLKSATDPDYQLQLLDELVPEKE